MEKPLTRFRASGLLLLASTALAVLVLGGVFLAWYPGALFASAGGKDLMLLILAVNAVAGPVLLFIVWVPGKKGMAFDIVFIMSLQAAALAYGAWVLFTARPVYIVFVKDRFELVVAADISDEERAAAKAPFARLPLGSAELAATRMPTDPKEADRVMMSGIAGVDIQAMPRYYIPYDGVRAEVARVARPIDELRKFNGARTAEVDALATRLGRDSGAGFVPLRAGKTDLTVIVDRSGGVVEISDLKPWQY